MASYEVEISKHATLTAGTADMVTLSRPFKAIEVVNRGSDYLFFRLGEIDPVPYGDNTFIVPGFASLIINVIPGVPVRLISLSALDYSVQGRA